MPGGHSQFSRRESQRSLMKSPDTDVEHQLLLVVQQHSHGDGQRWISRFPVSAESHSKRGRWERSSNRGGNRSASRSAGINSQMPADCFIEHVANKAARGSSTVCSTWLRKMRPVKCASLDGKAEECLTKAGKFILSALHQMSNKLSSKYVPKLTPEVCQMSKRTSSLGDSV